MCVCLHAFSCNFCLCVCVFLGCRAMDCTVCLAFFVFACVFFPGCRAMDCAVWLAYYPDGALREGSRDRRFRSKLPPEEFLRQRLCEVGGEGFDRETLRDLGGGHVWSNNVLSGLTRARPVSDAVPVIALARLTAIDSAHGPSVFSEWGGEGSLLLRCHNHPRDAYSLNIVDIERCNPVYLMARKRYGAVADDDAKSSLEGFDAKISLASSCLFQGVWYERPEAA